jgi:hypothetical protein
MAAAAPVRAHDDAAPVFVLK